MVLQTGAVSQNEAAERLGISRDMMTRLISLGVISPRVRVDWGKKQAMHFSEDDLERARLALSQLKWLGVVTPESWRRLTGDGLSYTLLSQRYASIADTLRRGHQIAFYVTGVSAFCGVAEVTGVTQQRRTLWPQGAFPFRVPLAAHVVLEPSSGIRVKTLLDGLQFIANKRSWEQYFRTTMRLLPDADFVLIRNSLDAAGNAATRRVARS